MKFGPVAVAEARGAILAHGLRVGDRVFKKGRLLSAEDLDSLRDGGHESVVVARLEAGDVAEDQAAETLATQVAGDGLRVGAPFTGRCNLYASATGVLVLDTRRLDALNAVDEAMTVATLPAYSKVSRDQLVATIKIIPFAVAGERLRTAGERMRGPNSAIRISPLQHRRVALLQTTLPGTKDTVLDKTVRVIQQRLDALGCSLAWQVRCQHRQAPLARELGKLLRQGAEMVLIVGASAIVDRRDVIPAAIEAAGGRLEHFGMPVDPGNLLLLAHHGDAPVLGLPGCARSPKFNGFDQVLERLVAGLPVTPPDIMAMGVGGLLKEIRERPQPRAALESGRPLSSGRAARVAALVLAAGQSRRMGKANKLLACIDGVPMVARVVDAALGAANAGVYVVTGHQSEQVERGLGGRELHFVHNPDYAHGLSTSLACGLSALPEDVDAALICLGDMPRVTARHMQRLMAAFDLLEGRAICVPMSAGQRGHPVLWARRFFAEMREIQGDVGARHLLGEHADLVCEVVVDDDGVLVDVDSPASLRALGAGE